MARFIPIRSAALAAAMTLASTPAPAQSDDGFGGSFETNTPPAQVAPPATGGQPPAGGGDDFGGSFGGGGTTPQPPAAGGGAVPPPPPPVTGGATPPPPPPPPGGGATPPVQQPPVTGGATPPVQQPPAFAGVPPEVQAFEMRDFGVPPVATLRNGQMHAPTPTSIPGGQVITTSTLAQVLNAGGQVVLIDVLGGSYGLPGAQMATLLASGGGFNDRVQQQAAQWLQQITGGNRGQSIVVYCSDPQCWLSYNASLRVIAAGYPNVYWYRGGLQAWQMAGLQLVPSGF